MASFNLLICEPQPLIFLATNISFQMLVVPLTKNANPPEISNVSPAQGTLGHLTPLTFRLADDAGEYSLEELWIGFGQTPLTYELVHDGTAFRGRYASGSSRAPVTGGWDYVLQRVSGWPYRSRVRLRASVVDASGNVVVIHA